MDGSLPDLRGQLAALIGGVIPLDRFLDWYFANSDTIEFEGSDEDVELLNLNALRRAQRNRTGLGRFVVTIVFPDDGSVRFAKTFGRHHFTIYETPEKLLSFVRGPAISAFLVEGERGDGHPLRSV